MTRYVCDVIYRGAYDTGSKLHNLEDIMETWEFAKKGEYFVPEQTWQYPDDLNDI